MCAELVLPRSLYLDTANMRRISDEEPGGPLWTALFRLVDEGRAVPVFAFAHLQELRRMDAETLERIDQRIGRLIRDGHGKWIKHYRDLQRIELEAELRRQGFDAPGPEDPFAYSLQELADLPATLDFPGFAEIAEWTRNFSGRRFTDLGPDYVEFQRQQRELRSGRRMTDDDKRDTIRPFLPDNHPDFPDGFELDLSRMPYVEVLCAYFEGSLVSDGGDQPSDLMDVLHLVGVAYSDVGFVDRVTFDRLRRGFRDEDTHERGIHRNGELREVLEDESRWS